MTSTTVIGLVGIVAAGVFLLGCFRRGAVLQEVALGELGRVRVREDLRKTSADPQITPDYAAFAFQRLNDTHLNGYSSYAEDLQITVFAEDLELERIERGTHEFGYASILRGPKDDIVEEATVGTLQWKIMRVVYDRHPVLEPSWRVLLLDRQRRVLFEWRGFQKQYSLEEAKRAVQSMVDSLSLAEGRAAFFAPRRSWSVDTWRQNYVENVAALEALLGKTEEGRWRTDGPWRYAIDRERPQRFVLMRLLGATPNPNGPMDFRRPVTRYSFLKEYLRQDNQGGDGGMLSRDLLEAMRPEFADPEAYYYYSVQTLDLWVRHESIGTELNEMRAKFERLLKDYEEGLAVGPSPRY